jgi:hypothetical protein
MIDEFCRSDEVHTSKDRIVRLLFGNANYVASEAAELYFHYTAKARQSFRLGKRIECLKQFAIAECFANLDAADMKTMRRICGQRKIKLYMIRGLTFVLGVAIIVLLSLELLGYLHKRETLRPPSNAITKSLKSITIVEPAIAVFAGADSVAVIKKVRHEKSEAGIPNSAVRVSSQAALNVRTSFLKIKTSPPWAKVYVDGLVFGEYPTISIIPLSPGNHKIKIFKDGYREEYLELLLKQDDTVLQRIELVPDTTHR